MTDDLIATHLSLLNLNIPVVVPGVEHTSEEIGVLAHPVVYRRLKNLQSRYREKIYRVELILHHTEGEAQRIDISVDVANRIKEKPKAALVDIAPVSLIPPCFREIFDQLT